MEITIRAISNGFVVDVVNSNKSNGEYGFQNTELLKMIEFIGERILDRKIEAKEK